MKLKGTRFAQTTHAKQEVLILEAWPSDIGD